MSKLTVELDFFSTEKGIINTPKKSLRDIQGAISKMKPDLLKSMISSLSPETSGSQTPDYKISAIPSLPFSSSFPRINNMESITGTAPLTIFYNGTVTVFDVPKDKAENIIKFAERGVIPEVVEPTDASTIAVALLDTLNEDLPIARKKSLQRFLEKRKERLVS